MADFPTANPRWTRAAIAQLAAALGYETPEGSPEGLFVNDLQAKRFYALSGISQAIADWFVANPSWLDELAKDLLPISSDGVAQTIWSELGQLVIQGGSTVGKINIPSATLPAHVSDQVGSQAADVTSQGVNQGQAADVTSQAVNQGQAADVTSQTVNQVANEPVSQALNQAVNRVLNQEVKQSANQDVKQPSSQGVQVGENPLAVDIQLINELANETIAEVVAKVHRLSIISIATRDSTGELTTWQAARELSQLAQGILNAMLHVVVGKSETNMCVLGMGKLGGNELNYISDVDVLFVHDGDAQSANQHAKRFLAIASAMTSYGQIYDMDANLRPEGRNGSLSRTIEGYVSYWERWAKTWEFQAMIKARPVAGDLELGKALLDAAKGYVWPEKIGADRVVEIRAMKTRVEASRPVIKDGNRQLKLAPGGIRDIEFAVQLLQLVHGNNNPDLQQTSTYATIQALCKHGCIREADQTELINSYMFLRSVEHRVQLRHFRRSHTIPQDTEDKRRLAHTMGYFSTEEQFSYEAFDAKVHEVQSTVRTLFEKLFYAPLLETLADYDNDQMALATGTMKRQDALKRIRALGFQTPARALEDIQVLASLRGRLSRPMREILPSMLEVMAHQQDPDGGLAALRDLAVALPKNPDLITIIQDNPPAARMFAKLLATSPRLGQAFIQQPGVLYELDTPQDLTNALTVEQFRNKVSGIGRREPASAIKALLSFKQRQLLRSTIRMIVMEPTPHEIGRELSNLGDAILDLACNKAVEMVLQETGNTVEIAVIAMGRYAGQELSLCSDLDVMFVHEGDTKSAVQAIEYILNILSSQPGSSDAFTVDASIRPEGKNGAISKTVENYISYWERWAEPWEFQALTRARFAAGSKRIGQLFMQASREHAFKPSVEQTTITAIRTIKARVEQERSGKSQLNLPKRLTDSRACAQASQQRMHGLRNFSIANQRSNGSGRVGLSTNMKTPLGSPQEADIKLGPGGLSDVEWLVQLMALIHGYEFPDLQTSSTMAGVTALCDHDIISAEEATWLRQGWELFTRVRNALFVMGIPKTSFIPTAHDVISRLSGVLYEDYAGSQQFLEQITRSRRRIRKVFERHFW